MFFHFNFVDFIAIFSFFLPSITNKHHEIKKWAELGRRLFELLSPVFGNQSFLAILNYRIHSLNIQI